MWEFPEIKGTLVWGPYNKDPTIFGTILGVPIFGNPHVVTEERDPRLQSPLHGPRQRAVPWSSQGLGGLGFRV